MTIMRSLRRLTNNTLAVVVSLIMITPVYLVFVNALKTKVQASSMGVELPTDMQWQNFATVIEKGKLVTTFGNSMLYAVVATLISTTLAALAAYALSRNRTAVQPGHILLYHRRYRNANELRDAHQSDAADPPD